jgi:hypothetical protein
MATINKQIAEQIIANDGYFADDPRVAKVVVYENMFDGTDSYALVYPHEYLMRYEESPILQERESVVGGRMTFPPYTPPANPELMRLLLNNIRPVIADGRAVYICLALPDVDYQLTSWVEGMLCPRCSFDGWMCLQNMPISDKIGQAARLEWIDYLLKELSNEAT